MPDLSTVTQAVHGFDRLMVAIYESQFNKPSVITRLLENGKPNLHYLRQEPYAAIPQGRICAGGGG